MPIWAIHSGAGRRAYVGDEANAMGIFRAKRGAETPPKTPPASVIVPQNARYTRMEDEVDDWDPDRP